MVRLFNHGAPAHVATQRSVAGDFSHSRMRPKRHNLLGTPAKSLKTTPFYSVSGTTLSLAGGQNSVALANAGFDSFQRTVGLGI